MLQASNFSRRSVRMRIQRRRPADLTPHQPRGVAVVIDVLRMTSTAAVLMRQPACKAVAVAATVEDLERLEGPLSEHVIVSELPQATRLGASVDNSPVQVSRTDLRGRTPVLLTTNGTRTLLRAAACAEQVFLASFVDLHAVARHLASAAPSSVTIVPAGHFASGESRVEDDLCAEVLQALLTGRDVDLAEAAAAVRADARVRRRVEAEPGFSGDLHVALESDPRAAVLQFQQVGPGIGRVTRAAQTQRT